MKPSLLIVGLGNPGAQYQKTRHNVGWMALDALAEEFGEGEFAEKAKFQSLLQEARIVTAPVLLVKPVTYMNRSGEAVRKLVDFYGLDPVTSVLVLTDDIDLPFGEVRFREKGGPGTHNGMKSLVAQFGEEFPRLRIGLGQAPAGGDLSAWVLSNFSKEEAEQIASVFKDLPTRVREIVLGNQGSPVASEEQT